MDSVKQTIDCFNLGNAIIVCAGFEIRHDFTLVPRLTDDHEANYFNPLGKSLYLLRCKVVNGMHVDN